jgi:hypothetical protein
MDYSDRSSADRAPTRFGRALFFAVGVGFAFGGGLVAGGVADTRVDPPAREPVDPLARAEARTRAYEAMVRNQQLTWHQELTAPDAAMPVPPALAKVTTKPTPTTEDRGAGTATQDKADRGSTVAEVAKAADPPIDDKALRAPEPEPVADAPARAEAADDAATRGARVDRDDENGGEVVTRADPQKLDAAIARVVGDSATGPAGTVARRYALQLASVPSAETARTEAEKWKKRGLTVTIVSAEVAGKGTMYRVRATGFPSKDAAVTKKAELNEGIIVAE